MFRTTIMLPFKLKEKATKAALDSQLSLGGFIRAAIEEKLSLTKSSVKEDPFFSDRVVFEDRGPKDVAENHDKYL